MSRAPFPHYDILVVDDDVDIRDTLHSILEEEGYSVECAANGNEALSSLRAARPCLILLDLMMPEMNGWDFHAHKQQDPQLADIPVLVISASESLQSLDHTVGFIRKPLSLEDLLDVVEKYC
jgi:CheY-like chemotaxis protein